MMMLRKPNNLQTSLPLSLPHNDGYIDLLPADIMRWLGTDFGYVEGSIAPIKTKYHSARYNVKTSLDAVDLENTYFNN